jgi:tetratricopeptide (TPR) repeat protein
MRLAVVRGASGSGRTELLRRCYEHIAWGQRYWPATLAAANLSQPTTPDPFHVPDGVAIPHMWLTLTGQPDGFPVLDAAAQLSDHLAALRLAVLASDSALKGRLLAALDAGLLVGSLIPFAQPITTAINVTSAVRSGPGIAQNVRRAYTPAKSRIAEALAANAGRIVNPGHRAEARTLVTNEAFSWARVARIVPFFVAADDAQDLDPATVTFLSTLLRHSGRGLMVMTINTDRESPRGPAGGNEPLASWLSEQARMSPVTVLDLDPVPAEELTELAVDQLGGQPIEQIALRDIIQASDGAPGRLMTLVADPRVYRALTHPEAVMPSDLSRITRRQILDQHWKELPRSSQEALAKLALWGPRTPEAWRPSAISLDDTEQAARVGWLRPKSLQFRSAALWETAYNHASEQLTDDQEESVLTELSSRIAAARRDGSWASTDPGVAEDLLGALIRGNGVDSEQDAMADLMRLRRVTGREAASAGLLNAIQRRLTEGRGSTTLVTATADALHDAGRDRQALHLLEERLETAVRDHGKDSASTIAPLSNLAAYWEALAQRRQGQPDGIELQNHAISLCVRVLELRIQHLSPQDQRIPDTRIRLADLYLNRNHPRDAATQLLLAVEEFSHLLGPDHLDALAARNNLAATYRSAGDLDRAIPLGERNLNDAERLFGPDHPDTLVMRNNLAATYRSAGDLNRAIKLYEQNQTDSERVLGPDHPQTLNSRNNLASAYESTGDLNRAIKLHEQNQTDRKEVLGPDHPDTLITRNNLAGSYRSAGDLNRAIKLYEQNQTDSERVLGPDHPQTLNSRNNLASAYDSAGDLDRAIPLYEQTLTDRERILGLDHPDTLASRNNLAGAYKSTGDLNRAIKLYEQTLTDSERVLSPDHPHTLITRNNLAAAYDSIGDLTRAIKLYEQTLTDRERVLSPDHPQTLSSRSNLAHAYGSAGYVDRAIQLLKQTLTDSERVLGPDHPHTLITRNNLAAAYDSAGDLDRAIPLYEQTLTDSEQILGPDHELTLTTRNNLAQARREVVSDD